MTKLRPENWWDCDVCDSTERHLILMRVQCLPHFVQQVCHRKGESIEKLGKKRRQNERLLLWVIKLCKQKFVPKLIERTLSYFLPSLSTTKLIRNWYRTSGKCRLSTLFLRESKLLPLTSNDLTDENFVRCWTLLTKKKKNEHNWKNVIKLTFLCTQLWWDPHNWCMNMFRGNLQLDTASS